VIRDLTGFEEVPQFNEADKHVHRAEDRHPDTKEIIQHEWPNEGDVVQQQVTVPQYRPRNEDQEQTDFEAEENESDGQQPAHSRPFSSLIDI
jgi:hypothetical protein